MNSRTCSIAVQYITAKSIRHLRSTIVLFVMLQCQRVGQQLLYSIDGATSSDNDENYTVRFNNGEEKQPWNERVRADEPTTKRSGRNAERFVTPPPLIIIYRVCVRVCHGRKFY